MHRKFRTRLLALFLSFVLAAGFAVPPAQAVAGDGSVMRVGLYYGSDAMPTANLANEVGSGYDFGYYDDACGFHSVGYTATEKITTCKDENLYLSGGTFYETPTSTAYQLIGAFHLQASGSYASYDQALAAAQSYPYGFPAYVNGAYVVRFEYYSSAANAQADSVNYSGATVVGQSATCYTVVNTQTGQILFEFDNGGTYFAIQPRGNGQKAQTWFRGYQYYGGFQYSRRSGADLTVINFVADEDYVSGVIPYELSASWPLETLKAGAVCARTFARATTKHNSRGFDVCNTTCCQVYRGVYTGTGAQNVEAAAAATAGECIYYGGKYIEAVYFAGSGGYTESSANTWTSDLPYLQAKEDIYDQMYPYYGDSWTYTVTANQVTDLLHSLGYDCATIVKMEITAYTEVGNVLELTFTDANGKTITRTKDNVRCLGQISGVNYMSRCFTITPTDASGSSGASYTIYDGKTTTEQSSMYVITADGTSQVSGNATCITASGTQTAGGGSYTSATAWVISGRGNGHNVGLSQNGAYAMGQLGFTYRDILTYYYTGVDIY